MPDLPAKPMALPPTQQALLWWTRATRRRSFGFTALVCLDYNPFDLLPARGTSESAWSVPSNPKRTGCIGFACLSIWPTDHLIKTRPTFRVTFDSTFGAEHR